MKEIFEEACQLCQAGKDFVLATVVKTSGSTPQKPGAKLLLRADGTILGSIGGGCVEAEVWQEAMQARRTGEAVVREFLLKEELATGSGLVCGGTMKILIDAIQNKEGLLLLSKKILDTLEGGGKIMLATVVSSAKGSVPVGAKVLVEEDGQTLLSSPAIESLEKPVREAVFNSPLTGEPRIISLGAIELFIEVFQSINTLLIVGGGHIAKALASLAKLIGFRVVVVDDREDFANRQRFSEADEVIAAPIVKTMSEFPISPSTFVVVATRGHALDYEALRAVVGTPAAYIGMLGSKRKAALVYQQLAYEGFPLEKLRHIHAPIGLNLGAVTPEEIALSIMAEIVMEKLGGDGKPLRLTPDTVFKE